MSNRIRSAVIGAGYLGRFHAQKFAANPMSELVAVIDTDAARAAVVAEETGGRPETELDAVLDDIDAVSIVVPTDHHYAIARRCLTAGKHVLLEKPMTETSEQARELIKLADANNCLLQVGHLERFNPVTRALVERGVEPRFIESNRIAPFKERGTEVTVVLDLMLHDLDIILSLVDSDIDRLEANGASVLSDEIDIANTRVVFKNGCVANITASRISMKTERKMRIFASDAYFGADFGARSLTIRRKAEGMVGGLPAITGEDLSFEGDALADEIAAFLDSIANSTPPLVSGQDGLRALEIASRVSRALAEN